MRCVSGPIRRCPCRRHALVQEPQVDSNRRRSRALGDPLPDRRDGLCHRTGNVVHGRLAVQRRCRRAHDLRVGHHGICGGGRRPDLRTSLDLPCADCTRLRSDGDRAGAQGHSLLHRHGGGQRGVLPGAEADLDQFAADLRSGAGGARTRGGAGRPVRHRPEQHAAWPVHVRRRRAACCHESPFQRNDEPVRRSGAARRLCARHHRRLRQRRIDFGGERKHDPLGDREFAGPGYHHRRSRHRQKPVAVVDIPADGGRRRRRAA